MCQVIGAGVIAIVTRGYYTERFCNRAMLSHILNTSYLYSVVVRHVEISVGHVIVSVRHVVILCPSRGDFVSVT